MSITAMVFKTAFGVGGICLQWKLFVIMTMFLFPHAHKYGIPGLWCFVGSESHMCQHNDKFCYSELLCRIDKLMGLFYEDVPDVLCDTLRIMCLINLVALVLMRKEMWGSSQNGIQSHVCSIPTNLAVLLTFVMIPASYCYAVYVIYQLEECPDGRLSIRDFALGHFWNVFTAITWPVNNEILKPVIHDDLKPFITNIFFSLTPDAGRAAFMQWRLFCMIGISVVCVTSFYNCEKFDDTIHGFVLGLMNIWNAGIYGVFVNYKQPLWWYAFVFNAIAYYSFYTDATKTPMLLVYQTNSMFLVSVVYICIMCLGVEICRTFLKDTGLYEWYEDVQTYHTSARHQILDIVNRLYHLPIVVAPSGLLSFVLCYLLDRNWPRDLTTFPQSFADDTWMWCICLYVQMRVRVSTKSETMPSKLTYAKDRMESNYGVLPRATNQVWPIFEAKGQDPAILMQSPFKIHDGSINVLRTLSTGNQVWSRIKDNTYQIFSKWCGNG